MEKTLMRRNKTTTSTIKNGFLGVAILAATIFGFNFCDRNNPVNNSSQHSACNSKPFLFYDNIKSGVRFYSTNSKYKLKLMGIEGSGTRETVIVMIADLRNNPLKEVKLEAFESKTVSIPTSEKNKDKIQIRVSMIYSKTKSAVVSLKVCSN